MTPLGTCERCGRPVPKSNAAYPVQGWEVLRTDGGANAIRNRERIGNRIRHATCLPETNVAEGQEQMQI